MGFKLGSSIGFKAHKGNVSTKLSFNNSDASIPGNPVIRTKMDIYGLASNDGNIYINEKIIPGSAIEKETLLEEMKHMTDMKTGKLGYDDNYIYFKGESFERLNGMINYNGKMIPEGDPMLPWENDAKIFENEDI